MTLEKLKHLKGVAAQGLPWDEVPCSTLRVWYKVFNPTQVAELLELAEKQLQGLIAQKEYTPPPKDKSDG